MEMLFLLSKCNRKYFIYYSASIEIKENENCLSFKAEREREIGVDE